MHTDVDGYVFGVRKNALQILLPRYGLETTLFLRDKDGKSIGEFNEEVKMSNNEFERVTDQLIVRGKKDLSY
jgi:hypothetical protein